MYKQFTDSQKLACDISRNIAVTAGAGSGKTSVLAERYLWCLENANYQVSRIVAITFTEKAAGEMLGRIRERILDRISHKLGNVALWEAVLEKLPLANISTIHGFCQRLLREFPIEAGVDPDFQVYDEALRRIHLIRLLDTFIQERSDAQDSHLRVLSHLWNSPLTIRNIVLQLIDTRTHSLPWAEQICQDTLPAYLERIHTLVAHLQEHGIRRIASDQQWQDHIEAIRALIPPGDTSKLTSRCLNILEYDQEFREKTEPEQQLLTLRMLRKECRMVTASKAWKEDGRNERLKELFEYLKTFFDQTLPPYEVQEEVEKSGFEMQQALASLVLDAYSLYQQEKARLHKLDFDDLQELTLTLLENPDVHRILSHRYDYLMVDEFQDTNHIQWNIIQKLGETANGPRGNVFCVVGDEKQSIYMFRGAEVSVFGEVRKSLEQINAAHQLVTQPPKIPMLGDPLHHQPEQLSGELIMAENFRSMKPLIAFFNYLFSRLFLSAYDPERPYDVRHQNLIPRIIGTRTSAIGARASCPRSNGGHLARAPKADACAPVELLLAGQPQDTGENAPLLEEPELVALRICELLQQTDEQNNSRRSCKDIAILLRARTRLKDFEDALRHYDIPYIVAGGIGFFQQQEIYDVMNLLRVLVNQRQDIALAGVLRSPLFNFSDDQLFYAADGLPQEKTPHAPKRTLWEKLRFLARSLEEGTRLIPQELDPPQFLRAFTMLNDWKSRADRIPITHLMNDVLDESGLYGSLTANPRSVQAITNIEKLLEIARRFEREGFQALHDFVLYLEQMIEIEEREGEAQAHIEGMDAVQLMTIHAAKGLEFPVVFVPELDRPFNYGMGESVYIDVPKAEVQSPMVAAGIKGLDPEQNFAAVDTVLREYLKRLSLEKTDAEMKRVFYVACTRAKEQLLLSGTLSDRTPKSSWLQWLFDIFPLQESLEQGYMTISGESAEGEAPVELGIPIRTPCSGGQDARAPMQTCSGGQDARAPMQTCSNGHASRVPMDWTLLRENLRPLRERGNERFNLSPSTLHLLLQCPRKYYYQHILHLQDPVFRHMFAAPDQTGEDLQPGTFAARRGTIVHQLFEEQLFDQGETFEEQQETIDHFLETQGISRKDRQVMNLDEAIRNAYQHYVSTGLRELVASSPEIYREYPFQLRVGQAHISGVIDMLFLDPRDHTWTILDYKSNDIERPEVENDVRTHGYDIQMQIYGLAVSRLLPTERVKSLLFFTCPGVWYEQVDMTPEALRRLEQDITEGVMTLSENVVEMCRDTQQCEGCEYRVYKA